MSDILEVPLEMNISAVNPQIRTGNFERIPKWLNLIPMILQWLWLSMRYGSVTLPSAANPHITSGGMVGDGKLEYFQSMGLLARAATADFIRVAPGENLQHVLKKMLAVGLVFPVVAKPNLGWCGYGVRLVENQSQLQSYLRAYPEEEPFLLQRFIPDIGEAGLFYTRSPCEIKGRIVGLLLRFFPQVTGDGRQTVGELIAVDNRLRRLVSNRFHECRFDPSYIPSFGETVRLALIGSTRVGGLYLDGTNHVSQKLIDRLDEIARDMGAFHVGRFDVRYKTLAGLESGEFTIMEVNGAGSEAVHAWDPKYTIRDVYRIVFAKQCLLFEIGAACRQLGHRPCGFLKLARLHIQQQNLMRRYPPST